MTSQGAYIQTLIELLLLFVYYAETKVDLIRLFKGWLHSHDLREGLFGMLERSVPVV